MIDGSGKRNRQRRQTRVEVSKLCLSDSFFAGMKIRPEGASVRT